MDTALDDGGHEDNDRDHTVHLCTVCRIRLCGYGWRVCQDCRERAARALRTLDEMTGESDVRYPCCQSCGASVPAPWIVRCDACRARENDLPRGAPGSAPGGLYDGVVLRPPRMAPTPPVGTATHGEAYCPVCGERIVLGYECMRCWRERMARTLAHEAVEAVEETPLTAETTPPSPVEPIEVPAETPEETTPLETIMHAKHVTWASHGHDSHGDTHAQEVANQIVAGIRRMS